MRGEKDDFEDTHNVKNLPEFIYSNKQPNSRALVWVLPFSLKENQQEKSLLRNEEK